MSSNNDKPVLSGLTFEELKEAFSCYPLFRSTQIYKWLVSGAESFDGMNNLPLLLRKELAEKYALYPGEVSSTQRDADGTVKLGITLKDGVVIEAVLLKDGKDRKTACLSTQAGCPVKCVFCKTGTIGYKRNLTAVEISCQFLHLLRYAVEGKNEKAISHIVIMGMGEPLLNLGELRKAVDFFTDNKGLNISKRRITVSTCGIAEGIRDLADNGPDVRIALSLTTAREELRQRLMPASKVNPLPLVKEALLYYQKKMKRRITLEMVLLRGLNTGISDAKAAREFSSGLDTVINLIPWNAVDGLEFEGIPLITPAKKEISDYAAALEREGLKVTTRIKKGRGISGACGQLGRTVSSA
jgi:23S rRNA (adenine2503-C2)-methyltransferase